MIVVSDTSPLSSLAIVEQLSLLQQLYGKVIIPTAVATELANTEPEDSRVTAVLSLTWIETQSVTNRTLIETLQNEGKLDLGESEAIALSVELNVDELLIDERLGRREAKRLGLSIIGVLGVLVVAKGRGLISAVKPIMDDLILQAGFRVSDRLYTEVLQAAGE
ncbi:MAG: DUF3368 domain-containing protein [Coleofasciculus sp. D1-CHI-01]|uniref:DUF3368 domain-containing protein n=1 Tax=Coleofasciculus sp. D1-CHI-01 TaxID=3068482 RepID=UPI003303D8E9